MVAMILLGVMIVTPAAIIVLFSIRCAWNFTADFCTHNWGWAQFLSDTIPVLVAIIMRGGQRPPRDEE
jgi:hypothetical protein